MKITKRKNNKDGSISFSIKFEGVEFEEFSRSARDFGSMVKNEIVEEVMVRQRKQIEVTTVRYSPFTGNKDKIEGIITFRNLLDELGEVKRLSYENRIYETGNFKRIAEERFADWLEFKLAEDLINGDASKTLTNNVPDKVIDCAVSEERGISKKSKFWELNEDGTIDGTKFAKDFVEVMRGK